MLQTTKAAPIRSFRLNCLPHQVEDVENLLRLQGFEFFSDDFFNPARRLHYEPQPLGSSLAAFFGYIYIQDRASMLPPVALNPPPGAAVLDMCASPGSKTGQLAWLVGEKGLVLANEPSSSRLATLRRNLSIQNLIQVASTCNSGENLPLPDMSWSYIQLDPPCSGWGTFEKNPKVLELWRGEKTTRLVALQRCLLKEAARMLKPGGCIVYSTCTTNVQENEEQIIFAQENLGLTLEELPYLPGWHLELPALGMSGVWRLNVQPQESQGFFIAKLSKPLADAPDANQLKQVLQLKYIPIQCDMLLEAGLDPGSLPGQVGAFNSSVHFLPHTALTKLPPSLRWQGLYCGKSGKNGEVFLNPRLRIGLSGPSIRLEGQTGCEYLMKLLQGQSLVCNADIQSTAKTAGVYWNNLSLGHVNLKNGRVLWSER